MYQTNDHRNGQALGHDSRRTLAGIQRKIATDIGIGKFGARTDTELPKIQDSTRGNKATLEFEVYITRATSSTGNNRTTGRTTETTTYD